MNYGKNNGDATTTTTYKSKNGIQSFWNDHIMERFIKANLFIICCIAAGLLLIVYLAAFSCEVSWILEARGDLPFSAYILCTQFFIVFVATTILIHGLVTGLSWGLFAWSIVIGLLSIPELIFVMIMTTQHWGLQSVHGLTELISYLVRLIINCFALICVIPTGLKWRRESQVLSQLQNLATRLSLQTPPPSLPITKADSRRSSKRSLTHTAFENAGYQISDPGKLHFTTETPIAGLSAYSNNNNPLFGSQNEFNASVFAQPYMQQQFNNNALTTNRPGHRAQSLMDLRCTLPGLYNPRYALDAPEEKNGKYFNITIDDLKNNIQQSSRSSNQTPSLIGSTTNDPIYCSIETNTTTPPQQRQRKPTLADDKGKSSSTKMRNCISLENLDGISKVQNDLAAYGHNLLQNYTQQQQQQLYYALLSGQMPLIGGGGGGGCAGNNFYRRSSSGNFSGSVLAQPLQRRNSQLQYYGGFGYVNYTNPYITANSKLSLGNESDDYRKYRDVAL